MATEWSTLYSRLSTRLSLPDSLYETLQWLNGFACGQQWPHIRVAQHFSALNTHRELEAPNRIKSVRWNSGQLKMINIWAKLVFREFRPSLVLNEAIASSRPIQLWRFCLFIQLSTNLTPADPTQTNSGRFRHVKLQASRQTLKSFLMPATLKALQPSDAAWRIFGRSLWCLPFHAVCSKHAVTVCAFWARKTWLRIGVYRQQILAIKWSVRGIV